MFQLYLLQLKVIRLQLVEVDQGLYIVHLLTLVLLVLIQFFQLSYPLVEVEVVEEQELILLENLEVLVVEQEIIAAVEL